MHDAPEFAGHVRQVVALTTIEYELTPQLMHVVATVAPTVVEYFPASQSMQVAAPAVVEYFPASQSVHTAVPVVVLYFPATQTVHGPPFGPDAPMLQIQLVDSTHVMQVEPEFAGHARQVVSTVAPTVAEYLPVPQLVQAAAPFVILYCPAVQAVQMPPDGPV